MAACGIARPCPPTVTFASESEDYEDEEEEDTPCSGIHGEVECYSTDVGVCSTPAGGHGFGVEAENRSLAQRACAAMGVAQAGFASLVGVLDDTGGSAAVNTPRPVSATPRSRSDQAAGHTSPMSARNSRMRSRPVSAEAEASNGARPRSRSEKAEAEAPPQFPDSPSGRMTGVQMSVMPLRKGSSVPASVPNNAEGNVTPGLPIRGSGTIAAFIARTAAGDTPSSGGSPSPMASMQLRDEVAALQASNCCLPSCTVCRGVVRQSGGATSSSMDTRRKQVRPDQWQAPVPLRTNSTKKLPDPSKGGGAEVSRNARKLPRASTLPAPATLKKTEGPAASSKEITPAGDLEAYAIGKLIGRGAFGKVNVGVHRASGQQVAIKMCDRKRTADGALCKRLTQEVQVLNRLKGHPSVVQLHEVIETTTTLIFVLELCTGGDLLRLVRRRRALAEACVRRLFRQLLSALSHMHSLSVAHRDIKLENLLLCASGNLKVADLGVATIVEPQDKILRDVCGTPSYMSPEVLREQGHVAWPADVWSTGVALHAMLCGAVPFQCDSAEQLKQRVQQGLGALPGHLSPTVMELLNRLLKVDPAARIGVGEALGHRWFQADA